ncbi:multiheme c-type cytochrome [Planctomycetota bacterium]
MKRLIILVCLLLIFTSCTLNQPERPNGSNKNNTESITIFFTGNERGALKPCGCTGGQLGGLNRRPVIFDRVSEDKRLIVDTGTLVEDNGMQDLIKFDILIQALNRLGYDLLCLSQKDVEIINYNYGNTLEYINSDFNIIEPTGTFNEPNNPVRNKFIKQFQLQSSALTVTIAACDVNSTPIAFIDDLYFSDTTDQSEINVNILILNRLDQGIRDEIAAKAPLVDCLIGPASSDQPMLVGDIGKRPLAFSMGRYNRYISMVKIDPANTDNKISLSFQSVPVTEDLEENQDMKNLYTIYQELVKENKLLENYPRFSYPDGLKYEGSYSCSECHEHESECVEWMDSDHSNAYATLVEVGSQYDPECIECHVAGMKYDTGYISEEKTPLLKDVGCENCHGPGNLHNKDPEKYKTTILEPKEACSECHTPEHDGDYLGHEEEKLQLIMHWTEPNVPSDVK